MNAVLLEAVLAVEPVTPGEGESDPRRATGRARGGGGGGGNIPGVKNCGNFVGLFKAGTEGFDYNIKCFFSIKTHLMRNIC